MNGIQRYGQNELVEFHEDDKFRVQAAVWLAGYRHNTRLAYAGILRDFFAMWPIAPDAVSADMVTAWKAKLQDTNHMRGTSIAQKLAGLSSYYRHLLKAGLVTANPVTMVERRDLDTSPYGNARPLTRTDFNAIWAELDEDAFSGSLYRALFLTYALTGRRRAEILRLTGSDIQVDGDTVYFRYTKKGGTRERRELPTPAWDAIQNYLSVNGRTLTDEDYIFKPTRDTVSYMTQDGRYVTRTASGHISGTAVSDALKRAAVRAGINQKRVTLHGLRHLAAELYEETHGRGDLRGLQVFLGHANIATTQVYSQALHGDDGTDYDGMAKMLFQGTAVDALT